VGAVQDVFVARAERSADSGTSNLETNVTGVFIRALVKAVEPLAESAAVWSGTRKLNLEPRGDDHRKRQLGFADSARSCCR